MTTVGPQMGTCSVCGQQIPIVNYTPATGRLPELGYLARHWRPGLRPGYLCRGWRTGWIGPAVENVTQQQRLTAARALRMGKR